MTHQQSLGRGFGVGCEPGGWARGASAGIYAILRRPQVHLLVRTAGRAPRRSTASARPLLARRDRRRAEPASVILGAAHNRDVEHDATGGGCNRRPRTPTSFSAVIDKVYVSKYVKRGSEGGRRGERAQFRGKNNTLQLLKAHLILLTERGGSRSDRGVR